MKLLVAETAGFCWGVRRALDQAVDLTKKTDGTIAVLRLGNLLAAWVPALL